MKVAIGIRANPNCIYYCITSENEEVIELKELDHIQVPVALGLPEQLKYLRSTLKDIINENNVTLACLRIAESAAHRVNIPRTYIEGVIQELVSSSSIIEYYIGQISNISSALGIDRNSFKPLANGETIFRELPNWIDFKLEERESILASFSALNLE